MDQYQQFIALSRYARWQDDKLRRETWAETVERYVSFFSEKFANYPKDEIRKAIENLNVMPSMRALMTAGKALDRCNVAGYNCSYLPIDHIRAFDELLYILMNGTGVGFSVERQYVNKLPTVPDELYQTDTTIVVSDSRIGWAKALKEMISLLYSGQIANWDISKVRPNGARLVTFGGRASGPQPLVDLFEFVIQKFKNAKGRKLNSIECHDIACKIADIVVVGGVRRSALISLSNLSDNRMRGAKNGSWWELDGQRALANNSVAYTEKPEVVHFIEEWKSLIESGSGERGLFNRVAATLKADNGRRETANIEFGTNPCGEIILRPYGFCNLSEVVVRSTDTFEGIAEKVRLATIIGTYQSTLTDFRYLRPIWRKNAEEERLLGVSLTGIMDHPILSGQQDNGLGFNDLSDDLEKLREIAIETNKELANQLGINPSTAITTVKPSGTVSQLVSSSSGIHPRFAQYYIRTVRADQKDPLAKLMIDAGVPYEVDVMKPDSGYVFSFPQKSPDESVFANELSAINQLEHYLTFRNHWCEHNPSITVYVSDDEWLEVGAWVYKHFDQLGGVSFLPRTDHVYKQAPYQEIDEQHYLDLLEQMPVIDWTAITSYEIEDMTENAKTLACTSGTCEL